MGPRYRNGTPQGPDWFDWLPRRTQCLLLLALLLPLSIGAFFGAIHCLHTGGYVIVGHDRIDFLEFLGCGLFGLALCGGIFAVMMGWMKPATPHVSETHHRKP